MKKLERNLGVKEESVQAENRGEQFGFRYGNEKNRSKVNQKSGQLLPSASCLLRQSPLSKSQFVKVKLTNGLALQLGS